MLKEQQILIQLLHRLFLVQNLVMGNVHHQHVVNAIVTFVGFVFIGLLVATFIFALNK